MYREIFKTLKSREDEFETTLAEARLKAQSTVAEAEKRTKARTQAKTRELRLALAAGLEKERAAAAEKLSRATAGHEALLKKKFKDLDEIAERISSILLARVLE